MALVTYSESFVNGSVQVVWAGANAGDTFQPYQPLARRGISGSVQFSGTTVTGVSLRQSNNGADYHNVKDTTGNDVVMAAKGMAEISCNARYIQPQVATGANVNITLMLRG